MSSPLVLYKIPLIKVIILHLSAGLFGKIATGTLSKVINPLLSVSLFNMVLFVKYIRVLVENTLSYTWKLVPLLVVDSTISTNVPPLIKLVTLPDISI